MDSLKRQVAGAAVAVAGLGIAACGSGSSFAEKANGICRDASKKTSVLGQPSTPQQIPAFIDRELAIIQPAAGRLRALTAPAGKAAAYRAFLEDIDRQTAIAQQLRALPPRKLATRAQALARQADQINGEGKARAQQAGLKDCAK